MTADFLLEELLKHKREINKFTLIFLRKAFSCASIIPTKKANNKTAKPSKQKAEKWRISQSSYENIFARVYF